MKNMKDLEVKLPLKVLQIGCGAFGVHLKKHLDKNIAEVVVTTDRDLSEIPLHSFDYIFLATNDSSLQEMVVKLASVRPKLVHFSGFHYFKGAIGLHPVASFNKQSKYNLDNVTFVADGDVDKNISQLFPKLEQIAPSKKQIYHNFMSVAANALQLLSYNLSKDFSSATEMDDKLLKKIVIQSLQSEMEKGKDSFSGPWVRGEKDLQDKTVESQGSQSLKNLNSLFKKEISIYNSTEVL